MLNAFNGPISSCRTTIVVLSVIAGLSFSIGPVWARQAPAAGEAKVPKQLLVTLHVTDKKDVPVTDLQAAELEVTENGQSRPVQQADRDQRPLAVALVVDNNTELSTSFMQSVVPAGVAAIKALPPGTTIDVWTTALCHSCER